MIQETMYGTIDAITVRKVAALNRGIVDQMYLACDAYVTAATLANPNLRTTIINIAGRQRMLLQKMSKEAALIYFGKYVANDATEVKGNEGYLEDTVEMFKQVHWLLCSVAATMALRKTRATSVRLACLQHQVQWLTQPQISASFSKCESCVTNTSRSKWPLMRWLVIPTPVTSLTLCCRTTSSIRRRLL